MNTHNIHLSEWKPIGRSTDGRSIYMYGDSSNPNSYQLYLNNDGKTGTLYRGGRQIGTGTIGAYETGSDPSSPTATTSPSTGGNYSRDDHEAQRQRAAAIAKEDAIKRKQAEEAAAAEQRRKDQEAAARAASSGSSSQGGSNGGSGSSTTTSNTNTSTTSASRGTHAGDHHGALDTSLNWKTVSADGNTIVSRNDETNTTMTHYRDGRIVEQVDGKNAYVAVKGSNDHMPVASSPNLVTENGQGGGYMPGTNIRPESSAQIAAKAEEARGEALNKQYGLGSYAKPAISTTPAALAADARGEALNKQYGLGEYAKPTGDSSAAAAQARGDALNKEYGLGKYASKDTTPTPTWETSVAPDLGGIGGSAVTEHGNALAVRDSKDGKKIIAQMADGSYQSIDKVSAEVASAGTWGDGTGGGKAVNGIGAPESVSNTPPPPHPVDNGPYIGTLSTPTSAPVTDNGDVVLGNHRFQIAEAKNNELFTLPAGGGESHIVSDFTPDVSNARPIGGHRLSID